MKKLLMSTVFFFGVLINPGWNLFAQDFQLIDKPIGKKAPNFTVKDLSGKDVSLSSFKGKPILLNFWATWCVYCRQERASLNSLHREYNSKGLVIISISIGESPKKVGKFLRNIPASFIVLLDEDKKAAELYGVYGLPTSFLINREGIIKHKFIGAKNWTGAESRKFIEELLK